MTEERPRHKTEVVLALIGLVGVLGGALFANWDKVFGTKVADSPVAGHGQASTEPSASSGLAAPLPEKPPCGTTIEIPPKDHRLVLGWKPVADAATYTVEVDCFGCSEYGRTWHSLAAGVPWHVQTGLGLRTPLYSSDVHVKLREAGGLAFRWRVWAVAHDGTPGAKSKWCKLAFSGG